MEVDYHKLFPSFGLLHNTARDGTYLQIEALIRNTLSLLSAYPQSTSELLDRKAADAMGGCLCALGLIALRFRDPNDPLIKEVMQAADRFPHSSFVRNAKEMCYDDLIHFLGPKLPQ